MAQVTQPSLRKYGRNKVFATCAFWHASCVTVCMLHPRRLFALSPLTVPAFVSLFSAACGGIATERIPGSNSSSSGSTSSGGGSSSGSYCAGLPACRPGDEQVNNGCPRNASCYTVAYCGTTLVCKEGVNCAAIPTCERDDIKRQIPCVDPSPPGTSCYETSVCGQTIWCDHQEWPMAPCNAGDVAIAGPAECIVSPDPAYEAACYSVASSGRSQWCTGLHPRKMADAGTPIPPTP
jgi:hypothetical protein